ncbi:MAG: hypothetical protein FJ209_08050 [Betaproteobacteria bacterium]|nr:hypothetical protein [Betaproteobacteria bacterium]
MSKLPYRFLLASVAVATALGGAIAAEAAPGRYRFQQDNTPGWTLMTPAERSEFQNRMWAAKTYDECKALRAEHRATLQARAKEQGVVLNEPRRDACEQMRARGFVK